MTAVSTRGWSVGVAVVALVVVAAAWFALPDPNAQPDGLVLRDRPPGSCVDVISLDDGDTIYVDQWSRDPDGGVRYRRGSGWYRLSAGDLAGPEAAEFLHRRCFPLGTDGYGRDLASRLLHGGKISLAVGFLGAIIAIVVGAVIGLTAGFVGGRVDSALMRFTDLTLAIPRLFLALLLVALYGASLTTTVVVLGATTWMAAARLVRGEVLALREREFVQAARASGASPVRTALHHVLPGALPPLLVEATLRMGDTILLEASLSFLGLGVQQPTPSWGNLVAEGKNQLLDAWWIATFPGLAVAATVIGLHLLGERARTRLGRG